jgi:hypothetical protein
VLVRQGKCCACSYSYSLPCFINSTPLQQYRSLELELTRFRLSIPSPTAFKLYSFLRDLGTSVGTCSTYTYLPMCFPLSFVFLYTGWEVHQISTVSGSFCACALRMCSVRYYVCNLILCRNCLCFLANSRLPPSRVSSSSKLPYSAYLLRAGNSSLTLTKVAIAVDFYCQAIAL